MSHIRGSSRRQIGLKCWTSQSAEGRAGLSCQNQPMEGSGFSWEGGRLLTSQTHLHRDSEDRRVGEGGVANFRSDLGTMNERPIGYLPCLCFPPYSSPQILLNNKCAFHPRLQEEKYFLKKSVCKKLVPIKGAVVIQNTVFLIQALGAVGAFTPQERLPIRALMPLTQRDAGNG